MTTDLEFFRGRRIVGLYQNYIEGFLQMKLDSNLYVVFKDCSVALDLGITGHEIVVASDTVGLGMALILRRMKLNPDDFQYAFLSHEMSDLNVKNEISIAYKSIIVQDEEYRGATENGR
jgi:hypothetical protein